MIVTLILVLNAIAFALMLWRGGWPERVAVALLVVSILAEPLVVPIQLNTWRVGVAGLNGGLCVALWVLSFRADRWWLILAAGVQFIVVLTHVIPWLSPGQWSWTGATIRLVLWCLLSLIFYLAAWEGWAAKRFALEGRIHANATLDL